MKGAFTFILVVGGLVVVVFLAWRSSPYGVHTTLNRSRNLEYDEAVQPKPKVFE